MKSPEHRAEMAARKARRAARGDRQVQRKINRIAMREYINRLTHDQRMSLGMVAAGAVAGPAMKSAIGAAAQAEQDAAAEAFANSVTPSNEDEEA